MIDVKCEKYKLLEQRKNLISIFTPFLRNKKVIFIDVPVYCNVGDSLIYLGTLALLKELNATVIDSISAYELARIDKLSVDDDIVFVCQGGGNFGDIYSMHQNVRHLLIEKFPKNSIVLMPQSIHYDNYDIFVDDCERYKKNNNFSIFVRDEFSFSELTEQGVKNVSLCPDIATVLFESFAFSNPMNGNKLSFMRKDVEAISNSEVKLSVDWIDIVPKHLILLLIVSKYLIMKNNRINIKGLTSFLVKNIHSRLADSAFIYFSQFSSIKTDRLHGVIFSQILQMRCEALDNRYGKIERYSKCWYKE